MVAEPTNPQVVKVPGLAAKAKDAIQAAMIVLIAALGAGFVLFVVTWAALWRLMGEETNAQGRAFDLSMILCGFGFVLLVLVAAFGAAMIASIRHTSLSASAGMQRTIETLAQQTERTNERASAKDEAMLKMIEMMMRNGTLPQLPAADSRAITEPEPVKQITTGTQSYTLRLNGQEVQHDAQRPRRDGWMYRLPDGREARGDILEGIIEHAWDDYSDGDFEDFRSYLRSRGFAFSNAGYRAACDVMRREGLMDESGKLTTGQADSEIAIERMRASARMEVMKR